MSTPVQLPVPAPPAPADRATMSKEIRIGAAEFEYSKPHPPHVANNDMDYPEKYGTYTKGLPHISPCVVDPAAFATFHKALASRKPSDFEMITLGGTVKLVNPQSGLAFDLQGADAHALTMPAAPPVASAQRAAEMVELYWMALCRDVPFCMYGKEPLSVAAIDDLNKMSDFRGPKENGKVTAKTLFRGNTPGELVGPYISQFFLKPAAFGDLAVLNPVGNPVQQYLAYQPGLDYMTSELDWNAVQDGRATSPSTPALPFGPNQVVGPRFLYNGRGGAAFVHVDELYQAYFMAALNLLDSMAAYDVDNPYQAPNKCSATQIGFGTFGNPHIATLVAEVATRALKAQWHQKWFVHLALRPEAYAGLVHYKITQNKSFPVHPDVLNSNAVQQMLTKYGTCMLPMAFPEGSPQHPSYGSGHATVAGACATIIKAYFNEELPILNPVESIDGVNLLNYIGGETLCIGHEANKIAGNVGMFRNHAGVHWRSDHEESIQLGEKIAISILQDQKYLYNEPFTGWTFTTFGDPYNPPTRVVI